MCRGHLKRESVEQGWEEARTTLLLTPYQTVREKKVFGVSHGTLIKISRICSTATYFLSFVFFVFVFFTLSLTASDPVW